MILAAIPIKPFGVAKARLAPVLGQAERSRLGRAIAARTAGLAAAAGAEVVVVTADEVKGTGGDVRASEGPGRPATG